MTYTENNINNILSRDINFEEEALKLYNFQKQNNKVYREFINNLGMLNENITDISKIPFLPVELFKARKILIGNNYETIFTSSGTTGSVTSKHYVRKLKIYNDFFSKAFELNYGKIKDYCILALLPGYLERKGSSLVYMAEQMIKKSKYNKSGFYLNNHEELQKTLLENESKQISTLLIGVTFGLLDFAEKYKLNLKHTIVMETGGMKGRRKEMTRKEVHQLLTSSLGVKTIHSEYGMTELLSQAYSKGNGIYTTPPWMKILPYDLYNPLVCNTSGKGGINIIDLGNIYSCAFIQTQDIGEIYPNGDFEINGRFDTSEIRGCNLMVL